MSTATARRTKKVAPPTNLIEEDGVPLESDWHRLAMTLLIESVGIHLHGCDDYFVGGNMFIHFNAKQARDQDFRGPDFFFVWEASLNPPRPYWAVWEEGGRYPDIIIELSSPTTAKEDHCVKKTTYERIFKTSEYFIYDPDKKKLVGWRLDGNRRYQGFEPNDKGWLWSNRPLVRALERKVPGEAGDLLALLRQGRQDDTFGAGTGPRRKATRGYRKTACRRRRG
jgi:Uma2 family endonuclease